MVLLVSVFDQINLASFGLDVSDIYKVAGLIAGGLGAIWGVGMVLQLMKGKGDGSWSYAKGVGGNTF